MTGLTLVVLVGVGFLIALWLCVVLASKAVAAYFRPTWKGPLLTRCWSWRAW